MIQQLVLMAISMLLLDGLYYMAVRHIYIDKIEEIQQRPFNFRVSGIILVRYLLMIIGLGYFIVYKQGSVPSAFLFGVIINGVTNGTMYASFRDWNAVGALLDTLWMGVLMAASIVISRV